MVTLDSQTHSESPEFVHAVQDRQYFLGIEGKPNVPFEDVKTDFLMNYLFQWVESEPDVHYHGSGNLIKKCIHQKEYNESQRIALKKAIDKVRTNQGRPAIDGINPEDFKILVDLAVKWRTGFCLHVCEDREHCYTAGQLYERYLEKQRQEYWQESEGIYPWASDVE